jgi:hypothetical protein
MIVAVKNSNKKRVFIKTLSFIAVIGMFIAYYFHMSEQFAKKQEKEAATKLQMIKQNKKVQKSKRLERIIYREIETAVDLMDQRNINSVRIISNKAIIEVDLNTNLDALKVRYGSMALIKKGIKDIKIAIDLKYIIENKYDEK